MPSLFGENPPGMITSTFGITNSVGLRVVSPTATILEGSVELKFTMPKIDGAVTIAVFTKLPD